MSVVHFISPTLAESSPTTGDSPACGFQGEVRLWPSAVNSVSSLKRERKAELGAIMPSSYGVPTVAGSWTRGFRDLASDPSNTARHCHGEKSRCLEPIKSLKLWSREGRVQWQAGSPGPVLPLHTAAQGNMIQGR